METIYQSLVAVNPVTLIAQICNLFLQLFVFKKFFWEKIMAILDQRREAADKEITDAQAAHAEADAIKATYEQNMKEAKEKAEKEAAKEKKKTAAAKKSSGRKKQSAFEKTINSAANTIGREVGKKLIRGLFDTLLK